MKKALAVLSLGLAFGGTLASAAATGQSTKVVMPVSATVANVCTFRGDGDEATGPNKYGKKDADGKTINDDPVRLGTYKANKDGTSVTAVLYTLRCTSFTQFDVDKKSGTLKLVLTNGTNEMGLRKLNVDWAIDMTKSKNDVEGVGDVHIGEVKFDVPAGQWNAPAGTYMGELKVTINYQ